MEIRQLRHFVAVAEHRNMLRAAEAIHVTQPALSKSVKSLEKSLGVQLLRRGPRGVELTTYGEHLLHHARLILNQSRVARERIGAIKDGVSGHASIGFGAAIAGVMLPQAVLSVIESSPDVTATIISKPFDELLALLHDGELDLAFVVFPSEPAIPGLVYEPLIVNEFETICRREHPLTRITRPVTLAELAQQRWAMFDRPKSMEVRFASIFVEADLPAPAARLRTSSVFALKTILSTADFLSYVPSGLLFDDIDAGRLVSVPTEIPPIRIKAGIVYRKDDILPAAAQRVVDELRRRRSLLKGNSEPGPAIWPGRTSTRGRRTRNRRTK